MGAHIGTHAVAFDHMVYPGGEVHAFEVQSGVVEVLAANARLSGMGGIVVHHTAIGDDDSESESGSEASDSESGLGNATRRLRVPVMDYFHAGAGAARVLERRRGGTLQ